MTILDLIIAVPLGFLIWRGYRRGAIFEITTLLGITLGLWAGVRFCHRVMGWMHLDGDTAVLIAFFVTFLAVVALAHLLGKLAERVVKLVKVGFLNNLLGAASGLLKGICLLSVLLYYVAVVDPQGHILPRETCQQSLLYRPVTHTGNALLGNFKHYVDSRTHAGAH